LDRHFFQKKYRDIIIESLRYCQENKGLKIYGYVIMTNHIHLIVRANGEQILSGVLSDFKSYTATTILKDLPKSNESRREWLMHLFNIYAKKNKRPSAHQFWQKDNHPIELYSTKVILQKLDYIHNNPIRAGWVNMSQYYVYSSASNYCEDGAGVLKVDLLDSFFRLG
jgi:putative transposase